MHTREGYSLTGTGNTYILTDKTTKRSVTFMKLGELLRILRGSWMITAQELIALVSIR